MGRREVTDGRARLTDGDRGSVAATGAETRGPEASRGRRKPQDNLYSPSCFGEDVSKSSCGPRDPFNCSIAYQDGRRKEDMNSHILGAAVVLTEDKDSPLLLFLEAPVSWPDHVLISHRYWRALNVRCPMIR